MKNIIALDIGGTSIKSAIVKSNGNFFKNSCKLLKIDSTRDKEYIISKFTYPIKKSLNFIAGSIKTKSLFSSKIFLLFK